MILSFNTTQFIGIILHVVLIRNVKSKTKLRESLYYSYTANNVFHHYKATTDLLPYHVLIAYHSLYCSGTLVRSKVVVTAATCLVKWQGQRIVVKVGSDIVAGIGQVIEVIEVKTHEYFGHSTLLDNDIAILFLREHVAFNNNVKKILMIDADKSLPSGAIIDVSGYADQQSVKHPGSLHWTEMTLLSRHDCAKIYPGLMTPSNFCAKYILERRLSDNGGPGVWKDLFVGILSYGADHVDEPYVAVFTNVSYFHRWINLNSKRFMHKYCSEPVHLLNAYGLDSYEASFKNAGANQYVSKDLESPKIDVMK